jgi:hypothetical protein
MEQRCFLNDQLPNMLVVFIASMYRACFTIVLVSINEQPLRETESEHRLLCAFVAHVYTSIDRMYMRARLVMVDVMLNYKLMHI